MKKVLSVIMSILLIAVMASCGKKEETQGNELDEIKKKGVITFAVSPDFAPYEFENLQAKEGENKIVGCEIELANFVAAYLGVELQIEAMDFASCQAAVQSGTVDFSMSGYAITEERQKTYNMSNPYKWTDDSTGQLVIVKKGDASKYAKAEDFDGVTIAAQNGSLQMNLVGEQLPGAKAEPIASLNDGILSLINGKIDCMACAGDTALNYVDNYPNDIEIAEFKFDYTSQGNAALIKKGHDALTEAINEAIKKAADQGLLEIWRKEAVELAESLGVENN